jgi:sugar phosphate isomerase/epimerase
MIDPETTGATATQDSLSNVNGCDDGSRARREFLKGAGLAVAAGLVAGKAQADPSPLTQDEKLDRLASNTYPIRWLFKRRSGGGGRGSERVAEMKKKYGEITMLDFPQFTKDTFPGVRHMDLWSSLFGDVDDNSMYSEFTFTRGENSRTIHEFDPSTAAGKKWLDKLNDSMVKAGVRCHHVSNNAPRNISDLDAEARREGIATAKKWLDGCAQIGAKTMRVNTGGPRLAPGATADTGYPRNEQIEVYFKNAVDSFKEMADYGGKVGVKVTIENHWGLSANAMNIRIILDEVNHPYCEASPDFCNWEHKYMLYHGLEALVPYAHTTVHAKYWDRWDSVDLARCVKIFTANRFQGKFALEYEDGPWDGVEGAQRLMKEVLAAL